MSLVPAYLDRYGWRYAEVEPAIWRCRFAGGSGGDFDLYLAEREEWLHLAVSPLFPPPLPTCEASLHTALLHLNHRVRLVRFAVDEEGDVALLADLPTAALDYPLFATTLDVLAHYASRLGHDLARLAREPGYPLSLSGEIDSRTTCPESRLPPSDGKHL